ncbi:MAG: YncE family protein, partial [Burkholderiaceae bacterium]
NGEPAQTADASEHKEMAQGSHDAMGKPGAVWAIDTATNAVVAKVPVGMHPAHVVVSPDGRFAYITNGDDNTVSVIDTAARSLVATIPVGKGVVAQMPVAGEVGSGDERDELGSG